MRKGEKRSRGARRAVPGKADDRADRVDDAFGPGAAPDDAPGGKSASRGPIPGFDCGGERCVFAPATALVVRFAAQLGPRHLRSLTHAANSGIELMKALREFLDEEIAIAERAAGKRGGAAPHYEKISVE